MKGGEVAGFRQEWNFILALVGDNVITEAQQQQDGALCYRIRADHAAPFSDAVQQRVEGCLHGMGCQSFYQGMGSRKVLYVVRHRHLEARGELRLTSARFDERCFIGQRKFPGAVFLRGIPAVHFHSLPHEALHIDARANGSTNSLPLLGNDGFVYRMLGKHGAGAAFPFTDIFPVQLQIFSGYIVHKRQGNLTGTDLTTPEQQSVHQRLDDVAGIRR